MIDDRRHDLEFDCNQETTLVRGTRALIDLIKVPFGDDC